MNFCKQLQLLIWKMFIQKRRRPLGTMCEIFLPVLLTSILIWVRDQVDIVNEPVTYGPSVPIFSIFDVDGLPVSLPGTIDRLDICLGPDINKFIAVTPDDERTRWFLSQLQEYYDYVSQQSLLSYYNWDYFASDPENFRDLLVVVNSTLNLCVDLAIVQANLTCASLIDILDVIGIDIYDDEQLDQMIAILNFTLVTAPQTITGFIDFLSEIELANLTTGILEFNVTDPIEIAELLQFTNETTVCEFLDFMTEIGRGGDNTSNFTITLQDMYETFDLNANESIGCNDSSVVLLDAITEQLFNVTFDDVLRVADIRVYSDCYNVTVDVDANGTTTTTTIDFNSTVLPTTTTTAPQSTVFQTTRDGGVFWVDNDTYCLNESDIFDVSVDVQEFLTVVVDILTLTPNPTLNLSDVTIGTLAELLNDSFVEDVIETALNITINATWIDDLYAFETLGPNVTVGDLYSDFVEWEAAVQLARFIESAQNGVLNVTNLNNIIDIVFGNATNFTIVTPAPVTTTTSSLAEETSTTTTTTTANGNISDENTTTTTTFSPFTAIGSLVNADGSWNADYISDTLRWIGAQSDNDAINTNIDLFLVLLSTPAQPECINDTSNHSFVDIFMFFDSAHSMEDYTQFRDYGSGKPAISAGIVFNSLSNESIDYTLRFNQSDVQDTTAPYVDRYGRSPALLMYNAFFQYINSGFLGWQNAIDQTFLRVLNYDAAIDLKVGIHVFPFPPYENDLFWSVVKTLLPLMMMIAFIYPFVIIAKTIVDEKALRLKEGFRILGGSNTAYLMSYMVTSIIVFTISAGFLVWCLCANVYTKTDPLVMFVCIELFGLCMISLAMMVGMLFDEPRLGALVACLFFLLVFYIYRFVEEAPYETTKNAICWSGPAAFALALLQINEYEEYQIGAHWSNVNELNDLTNFRLGTAFGYMAMDFVIYTCLVFYLDRVVPSRYGVRRPWYAPFECMDAWYDKVACCRRWRGRQENMTRALNNSGVQEEVAETLTIEAVDENVCGTPLLELRQITKIFTAGNEGRDNIAVNRLNLKMYKGQVFCLLGHNGAGKTTTCNMLTGMLSVTSGDALIKDADTGEVFSLVEQLSEVRNRIGLCPQHDILFPRMTVWEHLQFYGQVNGLKKGAELDDLCMDLINKIYLNDKLKFQSRMLSGGQKRKLSVCIALIGRTSLVILDEPTTGMDPFARRATWALIREYKQDRCIILTTHFMDEAEILADRIGIMVHGRLMCCGSAFYLKQQYDVGYALRVNLRTAANMNRGLKQIGEIIREHIRDDSARVIGHAATEIIYRISFESNQYLPALLRYFDANKQQIGIAKYAISATTLEEVFRTINEATVFSREDSVSHSNSSYNRASQYKAAHVPAVGLEQEHSRSKVSVDSDTHTSVKNSVTSKSSIDGVATKTKSAQLQDGEPSQPTSPAATSDDEQSQNSSVVPDGIDGLSAAANETETGATTNATTAGGDADDDADAESKPKRTASFLDGYDAVNRDETFREYYEKNYVNIAERSAVPCCNAYFWSHVWLQIWKRALNARRDAKTFWCQCAIPSIFILWGLATTNYVWWEDQPLYYFNTQDWVVQPTVADGGLLTIPYNAYDNATRPSFFHSDAFLELLQFDGNASHNVFEPYSVTPFPSNLSLPEWQDLLYATREETPQARYLSLYLNQDLDPHLIVVGANASAFHSIPTGLNLVSSFIAQVISGNRSDPNFKSNSYIKTASQPFPRTATQDGLIEAFNGFFTALILAIGLIFVPAAYIALLVDERTNMVKHQQLVSGMDIISYWTGNYIFDVASILVPATFCMIYVACFGIDLFLGEAGFATWFTIVMYGFAIVPFTYLASMCFSSPGTAQALTIAIYLLAAVICMIAAWIMDVIPDERLNRTNQTLKIIYRIFPPFCLSDAFRGIATRDIVLLWGEQREAFDYEVTGRNLMLMAVESVGYFALLLLMEYLAKSPAFLSWVGKLNAIDESFRAPHERNRDALDSDVRREQRKLKRQIGRADAAAAADGDDGDDDDDESASMVAEEEAENNVAEEEAYGNNVVDPIEIHGLRKVYSGSYSRPPTVAVQDLWYSVKKGQVFGFLGMNGAGKTSTLSMISGVFPATSGAAFINGFPITDQIAVRQSLGFCPQFSALFPRLTVWEHLQFFARIKGIGDQAIRDKLAQQLIRDLSLQRYTNRVAGALSGGNQRKLSVGIALIGNPPIVLMDEPTSGMDPVSKRSLWDFISSTMSGRSVILTTHSMEECEALCDRVGIMINGQLACLGSNAHLRHKFGKGYQLDLKYDQSKMKVVDQLFAVLDAQQQHEEKESDANANANAIEMQRMNNNDSSVAAGESVENTTKELQAIFGRENVELMESYTHYARYQVGTDAMSMADVFEHMESVKDKCEIVNYAVSLISLEQIFLRFAKEQRTEANDGNSKDDADDRGFVAKAVAAVAGCFVIG